MIIAGEGWNAERPVQYFFAQFFLYHNRPMHSQLQVRLQCVLLSLHLRLTTILFTTCEQYTKKRKSVTRKEQSTFFLLSASAFEALTVVSVTS